jgi:hypothetical protein
MKLGTLAILVCALTLSGCSSGPDSTSASSQGSSPAPNVFQPANSAVGAGPTSARSQSSSPAPTVSQPSPTMTVAPTSGAPLPASLVGAWHMAIDAADRAVIQQHVPLFDHPGDWTLMLTATTFELQPSSGSGSGAVPLGLSGANQFTVAPDNDCPDQITQNGGLYAFATDGTTLTLTPIRDDSCPGRQWQLVAHPWNRKG